MARHSGERASEQVKYLVVSTGKIEPPEAQLGWLEKRVEKEKETGLGNGPRLDGCDRGTSTE